MTECNMDDLICQMQVLGHLKGIKSTLGEEKFKEDMPELAGLAESLPERIATKQKALEETMINCGLLQPEEKVEDFAAVQAHVVIEE